MHCTFTFTLYAQEFDVLYWYVTFLPNKVTFLVFRVLYFESGGGVNSTENDRVLDYYLEWSQILI